MDDVCGGPFTCFAVMAWCPWWLPFGGREPMVEAAAAHIDYTILHCIFATMTSVTGFLTGNPGRATRNSAVSPKVTARGAIAHSSRARNSKSSQCSHRPTAVNAGIPRTASLAKPQRVAHQLAETAMENAKNGRVLNLPVTGRLAALGMCMAPTPVCHAHGGNWPLAIGWSRQCCGARSGAPWCYPRHGHAAVGSRALGAHRYMPCCRFLPASLRPTNGAIPAGLGAQWPRRWPPTILEPTSHNEDHLFKLTAQRCLALLVCKVMARVDQLIHSDATPPTIADEGFGEWRPWSHHQVSHERSPLLRLFTTWSREGSRLLLWGVSTLWIAVRGPMIKGATNSILPDDCRAFMGSLGTWLGFASSSWSCWQSLVPSFMVCPASSVMPLSMVWMGWQLRWPLGPVFSSQGTACLGMSSAMGVPGCVNFVDDLAQGQYLSTPWTWIPNQCVPQRPELGAIGVSGTWARSSCCASLWSIYL